MYWHAKVRLRDRDLVASGAEHLPDHWDAYPGVSSLFQYPCSLRECRRCCETATKLLPGANPNRRRKRCQMPRYFRVHRKGLSALPKSGSTTATWSRQVPSASKRKRATLKDFT